MRALRALLFRLFGFFAAGRKDREFAEEIEAHLGMQMEDCIRSGMTPEQARRTALIRAGGLQQAKEAWRDRRGLPLLETTLRDLHYATRVLRKTPGFTGVAILTLALGIGANTAIFSVVNTVLLRPLPFPNAGRLVMVWEKILNFGSNNTPVTQADYVDFRDQNQVFENIAAFENRSFNLSGTAQPARVTGARVSSTLFATLGVKPLLGRTFTDEEDRPGRNHVVVAGYGFWQTRFGGDPGFLGATIRLDRQSHTVIGIMPPDFQFPMPGPHGLQPANLWVPIAFTDQELQDRGNTFNTYLIARLKPGITVSRAAADAANIARRIHDEKYPVRVQKTFQLDGTVTSLREEVVGKIRLALLVLFGAVGFVLVIGCANLANLLLAKAAARQRELGIRAALGAARGRLIRQLLTESLLLSLAGAAAGLLLANGGIRLLIAFAPADIPFLAQTTLDRSVLAFTFLISLTTGVSFGLIPAFQASRADATEALRSGARGALGVERSRARGLLVAGELALSLVLVIGAGLLLKSFLRLRSIDPGFRLENLLTASISLPDSQYATPASVTAFHHSLLDRVSALPGVQSAGVGTNLPMLGNWTIMFTPENVKSAVWGKTLATNAIVSGAYFQALGIPLRQGRFFTPDDKEGAQLAVIINETLARRFFPGRDPVGGRLRWGSPQSPDPWRTIVGVVGDVHHGGLDSEVSPAIYMPFSQQPGNPMARSLRLAVRTAGDPSRIAVAVRKELASVDAELPLVAVRTMEDIISGSIGPRRFQAGLVSIFAALALLLAAVGLYGVMSYSTGQRFQEIGLRTALGATRADVLRLVLGRGVRLVTVGLAGGIAASFALTRVLASLLFAVSPTDWTVFAAVSAILSAIALVACYLPARRATRVDPTTALRWE